MDEFHLNFTCGPGYGGSCFPKDTKALARIAHDHGETISLIEATVEANEKQKLKMVDKIINAMGDVEDKTFAILGITFKPNTDDMRDAPALVILPELAKRGAKFKIYDPEGLKEEHGVLKKLKIVLRGVKRPTKQLQVQMLQ